MGVRRTPSIHHLRDPPFESRARRYARVTTLVYPIVIYSQREPARWRLRAGSKHRYERWSIRGPLVPCLSGLMQRDIVWFIQLRSYEVFDRGAVHIGTL